MALYLHFSTVPGFIFVDAAAHVAAASIDSAASERSPPPTLGRSKGQVFVAADRNLVSEPAGLLKRGVERKRLSLVAG